LVIHWTGFRLSATAGRKRAKRLFGWNEHIKRIKPYIVGMSDSISIKRYPNRNF